MTFPSNPQRRDWMRANDEAAPTRAQLDQRYGPGHRPAIALVGAMWSASCGCADPRCSRAEDDSRRLYQTAEEARHAAAVTLEQNEHGPSAGQEATS